MANGTVSQMAANTRAGSAPASTSRAASRNASGVVLAYWKRPGVGDEPDVQRLRDVGTDRDAGLAQQALDDLGRAGRLGVDEVECAEPRVVVVMVDVDDAQRPFEHGLVGSDAPRAAAVERPQLALLEVGGKLALDPIDGEEAVLVRHRGIACEVEPDVATSGLEREAGAEERPDRISVGALVGRQAQRRTRRQQSGDLFVGRFAHGVFSSPSGRPSSSRSTGSYCPSSSSTRMLSSSDGS